MSAPRPASNVKAIAGWISSHRLLAALLALAAVGVVVGAGFAANGGGDDVPVGVVTEGEFVDYLQLRGDIRPLRSVVLNAPFQAGELRILKIARNGSPVKKGDPVIEFDSSSLVKTLEERKSELRRTEAEIEKAEAQARNQEEQALTAELKARYAVDRARLDAGAVEFLSRVEAEQRRLALEDAEERLREATARLESTRAANRADLDRAQQARDKALADLRQAEENLEAMTIRAPSDGIVALMTNWSASGSMIIGGSAPEFRAGDRAWPGAAIAEIPDLSTALVSCRVDEADRGRLRPGVTADVRVDALPDAHFEGEVKDISALARLDMSNPRVRSFDLTIVLKGTDPRLRPGMSASVRLAVDRIPKAVLVPSAAVFTNMGETVAYIAHRGRFEQRPIEVLRRGTETVAVKSGLKPGDRVALRDPRAGETGEGR